jgi:hypothetical protein
MERLGPHNLTRTEILILTASASHKADELIQQAEDAGESIERPTAVRIALSALFQDMELVRDPVAKAYVRSN